MNLSAELVRIANREIGVHEDGDSNTGQRVNLYKAATNLPAAESWPWCAAFICWIVREAMIAAGVATTATFDRPRTASAWDLIRWSLAQDASTKTIRDPGKDIRPGDLIIFTFSHCGLATSAPTSSGFFTSTEGNTSPGDGGSQRDGGGVHSRRRHISQVKAVIRFTV
jgi:hypothetical protein